MCSSPWCCFVCYISVHHLKNKDSTAWYTLLLTSWLPTSVLLSAFVHHPLFCGGSALPGESSPGLWGRRCWLSHGLKAPWNSSTFDIPTRIGVSVALLTTVPQLTWVLLYCIYAVLLYCLKLNVRTKEWTEAGFEENCLFSESLAADIFW